MREIKFRGWNKKGKKMIYQQRTLAYTMFWGGFPHDSVPGSIESYMQFTGLKDKNGKEIYEKDIVTTEHGKEVVRFEGAYILPLSWTTNVEVIGNLFESPELLNSDMQMNGASPQELKKDLNAD